MDSAKDQEDKRKDQMKQPSEKVGAGCLADLERLVKRTTAR